MFSESFISIRNVRCRAIYLAYQLHRNTVIFFKFFIYNNEAKDSSSIFQVFCIYCIPIFGINVFKKKHNDVSKYLGILLTFLFLKTNKLICKQNYNNSD